MARTRLISPAFFKHSELYDAEITVKLPLRLAFAGLWTVCDKAGRFRWKPRDIKADVMPHDALDFADVLNALHTHGFVGRYVVDGVEYGHIPSWDKHQHPHKTERPSTLPSPLDNGCITVSPRVNAVAVAVTDTGTNYSAAKPPEQPDDDKQNRARARHLIRTKLYTPDGTPPEGWDEGRDGSILKRLRRHYSWTQIFAAIEGLALVRDEPGRYADEVGWMRPGDKVTLKALYNTRSGVTTTWAIATQAFWKRENGRPAKDKGTPESTGAIVARLARPA